MRIMEDNSIEYDIQYFRERKPKRVKDLEIAVGGYREANLGLIKSNNRLVQENKELKRKIKAYEDEEAFEQEKERESERLTWTLAFLVFAPIAYVLIKGVIISIA